MVVSNNLYILSNTNCRSCIDSRREGQYILESRPYLGNFNRIPDSIDNNAENLNAINFFAFSINNRGSFVYKNNGVKVELQSFNFRDTDSTYVSNKNSQWFIG